MICCIHYFPTDIDGINEVPLNLSNFYVGVRVLPSFFLNELCIRAAIRDFSNLCRIQKKHTKVMSAQLHDNSHVEFFSIHMFFTPLQLVLVAQYLISPSLMVDSNFVTGHDKSLVVHLLEPVTKRCLKGFLCSFAVQYRYGRFLFSSHISKPTELTMLA